MRLGACSDVQAPSPVAPPETPVALAAPETPVAVGAPAADKASSLGIWALVLAVLGLLGVLPIVGSVLGLVLGWVAVRRSSVRRVVGGRGLAATAVAISLITLIAVVTITVVYSLLVAYGTV